MFNSVSNLAKNHPVAFFVAGTAVHVAALLASSKLAWKLCERTLEFEYERQSSLSDKN